MLPGGGVGDALLEYVYERSLGNPLFAEELVREMQERSELILAGGSWHESPSSLTARVPRRVRALVSMRVASMRRSAPRVLALAAAATATAIEVSMADLRAAAAALQPPISDPALFDALDCALQSRILEERDGAYAFRHPLVRLALYEDLGRHRRDQLHAALGRSAAKADRLRLAATGGSP
jgi:predicted ATPase